MSSNASSMPPGPPSEVGAGEPHGRAPQGINNCYFPDPQKTRSWALAQPPDSYPYSTGWPIPSQYSFYHPQQFGYFYTQAGSPHPFQQPSFQSSQPSLSISQQLGLRTEQCTSPDRHEVRQDSTLNEYMTVEDSPESHHPLKYFKSIPLQLCPCPEEEDDDDASSFQPGLDVSFQDVDNDKDVAEDRPPEKVIPKEYLTRGEKMRLLDLLQQYEEVQRTQGVLCSSNKTYKQFFQVVFRRSWDSNSKSYNPVVLRPPRSSDAYLEIGHYEKDAPSSHSEDGCRGPKALKQTIPIFLTLNLEAGEIDWRYHDKDGTRFKAHDVTLHHGLSIEQAKKNVLDHQDQKEMKRICGHNIDQIVHAARRRIVKWAAAGSAAQLGVDDEDRVTLEMLELPSECFLDRFEEACILQDYLLRRPMPSYKD